MQICASAKLQITIYYGALRPGWAGWNHECLVSKCPGCIAEIANYRHTARVKPTYGVHLACTVFVLFLFLILSIWQNANASTIHINIQISALIWKLGSSGNRRSVSYKAATGWSWLQLPTCSPVCHKWPTPGPNSEWALPLVAANSPRPGKTLMCQFSMNCSFSKLMFHVLAFNESDLFIR